MGEEQTDGPVVVRNSRCRLGRGRGRRRGRIGGGRGAVERGAARAAAASGLAQDHGSRAEINRDATLGTVQTVTGNVAQDYSRNLVLYNNAFRVEVVRATDEASAAKQQLRDEILNVLDGLIGEVGARSLVA